MNRAFSTLAAVAAALPLTSLALKPGDVISGFAVKSVTELPEVKGRLVRMEYRKNGADLAWLDREDDNKTFAIGFRTLPDDDTGVPHIIEHSVLCGSDKYPVKEPFVDLLKSSFATFLNAFTSSDSTFYPVCSRNETDFLNLMDVYLDAVLHPLSMKSPLAFRQEGWHYELENAEGELTRNGIVYSEMKGAFASPERRLYHEMRRLLYPDTCYGHVSGGDPAAIPTLTYEKYRSFYSRFYQPSNARIFLDGKIDLKAVLAKLDSFLAPFPRVAVDAEIVCQKPVTAAKTLSYEIGADESPEGKVLVGDGWVFGRYDRREMLVAVDALTEALAGANDAPLKKALLDKGLCEDVSLGVDSMMQFEASFVAKNVKAENVAAVRTTLRETLEALAAKGLDHARLTAILDRAEFRDREKDMGDYPLGLVFFMNAMDQWLYGGDPAEAFRTAGVFAALRAKLETGYFEKLLREVFLDNPHHAEITMLPSATLGAENAAAEKAAMAQVKAGWTKEQLEGVLADFRALRAYQTSVDKPEDAAKLPVLSVKDVPLEGPVVKSEIAKVDGVTVVRPHTQANGVAYLQLSFSLDDLTDAELADVPMLARVLGDLATDRHSLAALRNELDGKLGRIYFAPGVSQRYGTDEAQPNFNVHVSALVDKWSEVVRLTPEVMLETSFADTAAVGKLLKQTRIAKERATTGLGARPYPFRRAAAQLTVRGALEETLSGFAQIRHLQKADDAFASGGEAYCARLAALAKKIFVKGRVTVCLTDNLPADRTGEILAKLPAGAATRTPAVRSCFPRRAEGFRIAADIAFAARVAHPAQRVYSGQSVVASRLLSLAYLWNEIRVKGGAYGGNFRTRPDGDAGWLSWNDPQPGRSLGVYAESGKAVRELVDQTDSIDRYIVSTVAATEPYLSARAEANEAMDDYLDGLTAADRQRTRAEMLKTTKDDLRAFADTLDRLAAASTICVLGGAKPLEGCKDKLDVIEDVAAEPAKK